MNRMVKNLVKTFDKVFFRLLYYLSIIIMRV